jgi:uncharacterized protein
MECKDALSVSFHLTHHCNLRCVYCYTGEKLHIPMSKEIADTGINFTLSEAKKHQLDYLDITFFGGEPLLEKELLFHIADRFIAEKGNLVLNFTMSTNGTLLTDKLLTELTKRQVFISLSVDGHPELHDRQRLNAAGKGTSKLVQKAAKRLLKVNPAANVTVVIIPTSADSLTKAVDYLFEEGFRYITLTLDYSADWTISSMKTLEKSYKELAKWYENKTKGQERFYLSCFDERIKSRTQTPIEPHERCLIGYRQFSIAPDGELYPCIQFVTTEKLPEFMLGHVRSGFSEEARHYFAFHSEKQKKECTGCALLERCSSWCACINYQSTGSIEKASPIVCHHEQMLMPIVDKVANRLWKKREMMFVHKHYNPIYPIVSHLEIVNE